MATIPQPRPQLQMLWPEALLSAPPRVKLPSGYRLRVLDPAVDIPGYLRVMHLAGFTQFSEENVVFWLTKVLPDAFFVITYEPEELIVATAIASHNPTPLHPYGGELGWVAGDPAHAGRGLGRAVCGAVVARFLSAGYRRIYLLTDDWRLPALKVYLQLGFVPFLFELGIAERWQAVCEKLAWPFAPEAWPRTQFVGL